jgi:hypothetical protein
VRIILVVLSGCWITTKGPWVELFGAGALDLVTADHLVDTSNLPSAAQRIWLGRGCQSRARNLRS